MYISFPIVPNRIFSGRTKNNRHFGYPETIITDFKISGTRLGTTLRYCRLIFETETEPGTKSRFHYLCLQVSEATLPLSLSNHREKSQKNAEKMVIYCRLLLNLIKAQLIFLPKTSINWEKETCEKNVFYLMIDEPLPCYLTKDILL